MYTSFGFREDLNWRFFHKNREISERFLHTKVSGINNFFLQLFRFGVVVFQVKSLISRVKCQLLTSKIDLENLENSESISQEAVDILPSQDEFCSKINWDILSIFVKYSQGESVETIVKYY